MKRTTRIVAALAAIVAVGLSAGVASAKPVHLSIDSTQSSISLTIGALGGAVTAAATASVADDLPPAEPPYPTPATGLFPNAGFGVYSGGADASLDCIGTTPDAFTIYAGEGDLSDISLSLSLGFLGAVNAAGVGLGLSLSGPTLLPSSAMPGMGTYDLAGLTLSIDQGQITYQGTGAIGGALGTGTFNFGDPDDAISITLGPGQATGIVKVDANGCMTLTIPINILTTVTTDPIDVTAQLQGQLVLTGCKVPEPGTLVLLGLAGLGLVPVIRRRLAA